MLSFTLDGFGQYCKERSFSSFVLDSSNQTSGDGCLSYSIRFSKLYIDPDCGEITLASGRDSVTFRGVFRVDVKDTDGFVSAIATLHMFDPASRTGTPPRRVTVLAKPHVPFLYESRKLM